VFPPTPLPDAIVCADLMKQDAGGRFDSNGSLECETKHSTSVQVHSEGRGFFRSCFLRIESSLSHTMARLAVI
jgi:hypothetical protein